MHTATAPIRARPYWNDTGITLDAGRSYRFAATGTWYDWRNRHDPDGGPSSSRALRVFEAFRRAPSEDWFTLMGAVDRDERTRFRIGRSALVRPARSGLLTCYANDVPRFYWNNAGEVMLSVTCVG